MNREQTAVEGLVEGRSKEANKQERTHGHKQQCGDRGGEGAG